MLLRNLQENACGFLKGINKNPWKRGDFMENLDDKLTVLIRGYREKPPDERKKVRIIFFGGVFGIWLALTLVFGKLGTSMAGGNCLVAGLQPAVQIFILILMVVGFGAFAYKLHRTYDIQNTPIGTNKGGKSSAFLMSRGTAGSARFMTDDEIRKKYSVGGINTEIEDEDGPRYLMTEDLLGQLESSIDGSAVVTNRKPKDPDKIEQNNNIVFGASGRGKSFGFVRPLMIMAGRRGSSVVVTDPSGELYSSMSYWYRTMGYKIVCFNANNIAFSDCWDFFTETTDIETGRLKQSKLESFCSVFFDNSKGDTKKDFWYTMELLVFRILVALCSWYHEDDMMQQYRNWYIELGGNAQTASKFAGMTSFVWCRKELTKTAKRKGLSEAEIQKKFKEIENNADKDHPFTISQVIKMAQTFADENDKNKKVLQGNSIPNGHPAKMDYSTFCNSKKPEQQAQYIIGMLGRLSIFNDWEIRTVCSNKGINLRNINKEKTAVFICTSDKQSNQVVVRPIVSLLFTFLFDDIMDSYDYEEQLAISENRKNPCLPVSIILDELFSIGTLGAKDEKTNSYMLLPTVFAEARKRKITNTLIVQDVTMLKSLYGENGMSTLINNTKNQISLGVYDQASADYLSKMLGKTTVMSESHKFGEHSTGIVSNLSETGRDLKTAAETRMLEDYHLFLQTAGNQPALLKTVPYTCIAPFCYSDEKKPKTVSMRDRLTLYDRDAQGMLRKDGFDAGFHVSNISSIKDEDEETTSETTAEEDNTVEEDVLCNFQPQQNKDESNLEKTQELPIIHDEETGEVVESIEVFNQEKNSEMDANKTENDDTSDEPFEEESTEISLDDIPDIPTVFDEPTEPELENIIEELQETQQSKEKSDSNEPVLSSNKSNAIKCEPQAVKNEEVAQKPQNSANLMRDKREHDRNRHSNPNVSGRREIRANNGRDEQSIDF